MNIEKSSAPSRGKKTNLLSENDMVQLVEASEPDRSALAEAMRPIRNGEAAPWLAEAVGKDHYKITTIRHNGVPVFVLWWWFSPGNKALVLNEGASLVRHNVFDVFLAGVDQLVKQTGAVQIQTRTRRPGLIRKYLSRGWHVEGVSLRKMVE